MLLGFQRAEAPGRMGSPAVTASRTTVRICLGKKKPASRGCAKTVPAKHFRKPSGREKKTGPRQGMAWEKSQHALCPRKGTPTQRNRKKKQPAFMKVKVTRTACKVPHTKIEHSAKRLSPSCMLKKADLRSTMRVDAEDSSTSDRRLDEQCSIQHCCFPYPPPFFKGF